MHKQNFSHETNRIMGSNGIDPNILQFNLKSPLAFRFVYKNQNYELEIIYLLGVIT